MAIDKDIIAFASPVHPTDKVVELIEGSHAVPAVSGFTPGTKATVVAHNQSEKCLPQIMWSTDNVNFYPGAMWRYPTAGTPLTTTAYCTDNNVVILTGNFGTAVTVYYKVFLLWPM